jgi:hypothetical protein
VDMTHGLISSTAEAFSMHFLSLMPRAAPSETARNGLCRLYSGPLSAEAVLKSANKRRRIDLGHFISTQYSGGTVVNPNAASFSAFAWPDVPVDW